MNTTAPSRWEAWVLAARPKTLAAGIVPVLVGTALAAGDGAMAILPALACLVGSLLIQIGTNLANDVFDFRRGADTTARIGPARAVQQGWLSPSAVGWATAGVLGAALLVGIYLIAVGGWGIAIIGVLSLFCAVTYTGGPMPLAYIGLGDLFVLLFFGYAAVGGTYWVQAHSLSPSVWMAGTSIGLIATAILVVNNLRDRHTDAQAGKRTLAVRFGARAARVEYTTLIGLAFMLPSVGAALNIVAIGWLWVWLAVPLAVHAVWAVWSTDGAALNPLLGATARLELAFGLLLCVGVLV